eukprot:3472834-Lingulodinium_polyedra.AAC.1
MACVGVSFWKGQVLSPGAHREQVCVVAQKVPAIQTCKDQVENNKRMRQRRCIQKVLDHLMKHPYTRQSIWATNRGWPGIGNGDACVSKEQSQVMAGFLAAMPGGPDQNLLDKMHNKGTYAIPG